MTGPGPLRAALAVAVASLALVVGLSPAASALDVSSKAIKVEASHEYPDNVEAYATEIEDVTTLDGRGGAIAVLDTGVDDDHPTFQNAFVAGAEYRTSCDCMRETDWNGEQINPDDTDGHGTHVASIALGRGGSDLGPAGVAPGAGLVDVKISNTLGFSASTIQKGIDWVIDYNEGNTNWTANTKVRVIVLSFANLDAHEEREYDAAMDAVKRAHDNGILVVPAAGNCGPDSGNVSTNCSGGGDERDRIPSPGAAPEALTVGAVDDNGTVRRSQDQVAGYSSRGPNPADSASDERWRKPDVVAPGTDITAACPTGGFGSGEDMDCTKSGTSMAAPHVAGLAAVLWQAIDRASDDDPSPGLVKDLITDTALDIGEEGWDRAAGYGYVDGYEAVVQATNTPPESFFEVVPTDPEAGESLTLDASDSSDPDKNDEIETFVWTIDGETETLPGDQPQLHRVFDETGNHEIELTTIDTRGAEDPEPMRRTIHVEPEPEEPDEGQPPTVDLAFGPTPLQAGQQAWFDLANSSDPDGDALASYAWDFTGDGEFQTSQDPKTTWTFEEPGEHAIEARVTDDTGASATQTVALEVHEPPSDSPDVAITNPQEGDVLAAGTVNVTWISSGGPTSSFALSVDQAAVDQTEDTFLEVHLSEDDRTIALKAHGPGGEHVDRVNVSVVEDESLERSSADNGSTGEDEASSNPPRHTTSPGDQPAADEDAQQPTDPEEEPAPSEDPDLEDDQEENQAPASGVALALGAVLSAAALLRRS